MKNEWQTFLAQLGASVNDLGVVDFETTPREDIKLIGTECLLTSLDELGVIQVTGNDAQSFLQGQFSNDITLTGQSHSQISAYCNPKGRILAQFLIIPQHENYYLLCPKIILEKTLARLRMFVLRSQVTLTDQSDEWVCLGLVTAGNTEPGIAVPNEDYDLITTEQYCVTKIPSIYSRYLFVTTTEAAKNLWQSLGDSCRKASNRIWHWLDIQAGLPYITVGTVEEFVPQMVNLELINGVNFKKGCYPGQEIVARMHYLGKPKRRMFRFHTDSEQSPEPGTDLYLHNGDGQSAGKVVMAQPDTDKGTDLLAVIRLNHADSHDLRLGSVEGPLLQSRELPYKLENDS